MASIIEAIKPQWWSVAASTAALGCGLGAGIGITLRLFARKKVIQPAGVQMKLPQHAVAALVEMTHASTEAMAPITSKDADQPKLPSNFIHVPLVAQHDSTSSGIICLQALLTYWGDSYRYDKLYQRCNINHTGKHDIGFSSLATTARSLNYTVNEYHNMKLGDLFVAINQKQPVLVCLQAWPQLDDTSKNNYDWSTMWNHGRYAIVVGYDTHHIYFMDPATLGHYTCILIESFLERWHGLDPVDPTIRLQHVGMTLEKEHTQLYQPQLIISMQ